MSESIGDRIERKLGVRIDDDVLAVMQQLDPDFGEWAETLPRLNRSTVVPGETVAERARRVAAQARAALASAPDYIDGRT